MPRSKRVVGGLGFLVYGVILAVAVGSLSVPLSLLAVPPGIGFALLGAGLIATPGGD